MGFTYQPHGLSIQLPLIPQIFNIFNMHYFKECQNFHSSHLWSRGRWHWHMLRHVTLISVWLPFHILRELTCCFYFKTVSWYLINETNSTGKVQMNSTVNRDESVKISSLRMPLIYFSGIDGISLLRSIVLSLSMTEFNLVNSSGRILLNFHLFRGFQICTPRTSIHSQLIFQAMSEFSRNKSPKPKWPSLHHFLNYDL